jgi:hypothetical protein
MAEAIKLSQQNKNSLFFKDPQHIAEVFQRTKPPHTLRPFGSRLADLASMNSIGFSATLSACFGFGASTSPAMCLEYACLGVPMQN